MSNSSKNNSKKKPHPDKKQFVEYGKRGGRPKKEVAFVREFKRVIDQHTPNGSVGFAIIYTDEQLVDVVNRGLKREERISLREFQRYKAGKLKDSDENGGILSQFQEYYRQAQCDQLHTLFDRMTDEGEKRSWQRWAWIIERKFEEWNKIEKRTDETPEPRRLVFHSSNGSIKKGTGDSEEG